MSFFEDLKRRNVIRVAAAYAVVGWLVIQVAETIFPVFGFDERPTRIVVILVAIGFPLTLIFSWVYEFTPDGLKLERDIDPSRSNTRYTGKKLDRTIIVALAIALSYFAVDKFILAPARDVTLEEIVAERVRDELLVESNGDRSIAVLPFADMSPNGDQEYFCNGIADELRLELQRLDGLRVAGRTSTIASAQNDSKSIGETLNVDSILEGSIRKEGNSVRIAVQLTNVTDGITIWSNSYDRELENIFEMQEEIASSVAGFLGVNLGVGTINAFQGAGTRNVEAYEIFLQARAARSEEAAIRLLERATKLDPNYAAAWSLLGHRTLRSTMNSNPGELHEILERAYALAQRALALDSELAESNARMGLMLQIRGDLIGGEEAYFKALSLLSDAYNLGMYGNFLMRAGRSAAALEFYEKSEAVEPSLGQYDYRVYVALAQGRFADARKVFARSSSSVFVRYELTIALNEGDPEEIKAIMAALPQTAISTTELYAPVLKVFDSRERVRSALQKSYADNGSMWPSKFHDIALLAAYFGDPELALQSIGQEWRKVTIRRQAVWYPVMSDVRQLPGFKELVTDLNLVAYWRASGWADVCRPLGDDDFECF